MDYNGKDKIIYTAVQANISLQKELSRDSTISKFNCLRVVTEKYLCMSYTVIILWTFEKYMISC